jgi:predicted ArsR family transcriptional regulator
MVDLMKIMRCQALGAPEVSEHLGLDEERGRGILRELEDHGVVVCVAEARPRHRGRSPALYRLSPEWGGM